MSALNDLTVGLRDELRAAGLVAPSTTAPTTDRTVTLTVARLSAPSDADGEAPTGALGGGTSDVRVSCVLRSGRDGDTRWIGDTLDAIERAIGSIRNRTVAGVWVSFVTWEYSADLGVAADGRPEASVNYRARCALPVLQ